MAKFTKVLRSECRRRDFASGLMFHTGTDLSFKQRPFSSPISPSTKHNSSSSGGLFYDISLSSSFPICRICHCSNAEEDLFQPCRCSGSVGFTHQSCIRKWIVGSTNFACELCNYEFNTEKQHVFNIRKVRFPRPTLTGWLHILLFLAFFSMMMTSLTWIMWSQFSSSRAAQSERDSKEITYAYAVNGGFIIMALLGLYLDSFGQCQMYFKRWSLMNQDLVIFPYDVKNDIGYCNKSTGLVDTTVDMGETLSEASMTLSTSPDKSDTTEALDASMTMAYQNAGFVHEAEILKKPIDTHSEITSQDSLLDQHRREEFSFGVHKNSIDEQSFVRQSVCAPADLQHILFELKETYV